MMRMVMEVVMVFAVVGILMFMSKIGSSQNETDENLPINDDVDKSE